MAENVEVAVPSPIMVEPYKTMSDVSNYVQDIIWVILIILELLTVIFFVIEFSKKTSYFRTSYYILLATGLAVDIFCQTLTLRRYIVPNSDISSKIWWYIEGSSSFYLAIYSDVWNITLILNRCTAIWFTFYSSRIWGFHGTIVATVTNFLSPYIVIGFILFQPDCVSYVPSEDPNSNCSKISSISYITIGSFTAVSAATMTAFVIYCSKTRVQTFSEKSAAIEKRLIYQSILCLILLSIYHLLRSGALFLWENGILNVYFATIMEDLAMLAYIIQHFLEIFVLFIVSPTFRTAILKFYSFGRYKSTTMGKTITQVTILSRLYK